MKSLLLAASLALTALAQQATIVSPAPGSTITPGSEITIEVHQDGAATDDVQVAIILGFRSCPGGTCDGFDPAEDGVGTIVYSGAFNPQHDPNQPQKGLFQDFKFQVPTDSTQGASTFSLAHLQAVGAVKVPEFNVNNIVVTVGTPAAGIEFVTQ
ncbi:hypothetical protein C8Q78DRAFT_613235 [Trametes maxima]|nr:hypothetical protein C8Q78DRAFT_613235 [Trametes maxima]